MKRLMTLIFSLGLFVCGLVASEDYSQQSGQQGICTNGTCSTGVCSTKVNNTCTQTSSSQSYYYSTPQPISTQYNYVPQHSYSMPTYSSTASCGNVQYSSQLPTANIPRDAVAYPSVQYTNVCYQPAQTYQSVNYSQATYHPVQYASQPVVQTVQSLPTSVQYDAGSVSYSSTPVQYSTVVNGQTTTSYPYAQPTYAINGSVPVVNQAIPQTYTATGPASPTVYYGSNTVTAYQPNTYNQTCAAGGSTSGLAQQKAQQAASMCLKGHVGGGLGGARYEGVGWSNMSAKSAIQSCCYWGRRPVYQMGVSRGADGCWYACVLYN